jgi:hypothetical protein
MKWLEEATVSSVSENKCINMRTIECSKMVYTTGA